MNGYRLFWLSFPYMQPRLAMPQNSIWMRSSADPLNRTTA